MAAKFLEEQDLFRIFVHRKRGQNNQRAWDQDDKIPHIDTAPAASLIYPVFCQIAGGKNYSRFCGCKDRIIAGMLEEYFLWQDEKECQQFGLSDIKCGSRNVSSIG